MTEPILKYPCRTCGNPVPVHDAPVCAFCRLSSPTKPDKAPLPPTSIEFIRAAVASYL